MNLEFGGPAALQVLAVDGAGEARAERDHDVGVVQPAVAAQGGGAAAGAQRERVPLVDRGLAGHRAARPPPQPAAATRRRNPPQPAA